MINQIYFNSHSDIGTVATWKQDYIILIILVTYPLYELS